MESDLPPCPRCGAVCVDVRVGCDACGLRPESSLHDACAKCREPLPHEAEDCDKALTASSLQIGDQIRSSGGSMGVSAPRIEPGDDRSTEAIEVITASGQKPWLRVGCDRCHCGSRSCERPCEGPCPAVDESGPPLCGRCAEPVKGVAVIDGVRYCHEGGDPTCYMLESWERDGLPLAESEPPPQGSPEAKVISLRYQVTEAFRQRDQLTARVAELEAQLLIMKRTDFTWSTIERLGGFENASKEADHG